MNKEKQNQNQNNPANLDYQDENKIISIRREKLSELKDKGTIYPNFFRRDSLAKELHDQFDQNTKEELSEKNIEVKVAGRMMFQRLMGKASFATVQDMSGMIQLYINIKNVGEEQYADFKHWDLGDIVGAEGVLFKTNHGELSVKVTHFYLLAKSLRPLPEKYKGLADKEQRSRQRYVDLMMNKESKETFIKRSKIIQKIREIMIDEKYLEVETPMMHPIPGGANAKPFITYHNTLDMQLYLRVAPELYLKRLVVGGLERVFEINRSFRNEGISTRHNPEFTMIEFYEAFANYERMMDLSEKIIKECALLINGTTQIIYDGKKINLDVPFEKLTITEAILKYNPKFSKENMHDIEWLKKSLKLLKNSDNSLDLNLSLGELQLHLFEETTESKLWEPTFIVDYPIEVSPLARKSDQDGTIAERFELFVVGRELANGYSELNDPEDQSKRFKLQVSQKESGNDEAMHYDSDYIKAMEYGLPPTGGCGIGIDRLVMLLTDKYSIRDVILFPLLRPSE